MTRWRPAAVFAATCTLASLGGCPTQLGTSDERDQLLEAASPPPSTDPTDTNPEGAAIITLRELSRQLVAGESVTISSGSQAQLVGLLPAEIAQRQVSVGQVDLSFLYSTFSPLVVPRPAGFNQPANSPPGSGGLPPALLQGSGIYDDEVSDCAVQQVDGFDPIIDPQLRRVRMEINALGQLQSVYLPAPLFVHDLHLVVTNEGDSATVNGTFEVGDRQLEYSLQARVTEISYGAGAALATIELAVAIDSATLRVFGSGRQQLNAGWNAEWMRYQSETVYDLELTRQNDDGTWEVFNGTQAFYIHSHVERSE